MDARTVGVWAVVLVFLFVGAAGVTAADGAGDAGTTAVETDTAHEFEVTILGTNAPVEGDPLTVTAMVENVGDGAGAGPVSAVVGPLGAASQTVDLGAGESTEVTLSIGTDIEDTRGSPYTVTLTSADDVDSAVVAVVLPPVGTAETPPRDLTGNGVYEDIDGDGERTIFDVQALFNFFDDPAVQNHRWAFDFTGDESVGLLDVQTLFEGVVDETVDERATFAVNITSVDSDVPAGETVSVEYEVTNTGNAAGVQNITFGVNSTVEETVTDVALDTGESTSGTFTYETSAATAPGIAVSVASADDAATDTVSVAASATFAVTITSIDGEVAAGETLSVGYEVTNTGEAAATQNITFAVNGTTEGTAPGVTLAGGETRSGTFGYETGTDDVPGVTVTVSSEDDSETATVNVTEAAIFAVTITEFDEAVTVGENVSVGYEVTNTGDTEQTQDISFRVDGALEDTEADVTLTGGETFNGTFAYGTVADDVPEVSVNVTSEDDSAERSVTVNEPAAFAVTITAVDDPVAGGETVTVGYRVENTGDVEATQDIVFAVNGTTEDTRANLTLAGGETFDGTFTYETTADDTPGLSVSVASADETATETVTVLEPAVFAVNITNVPGEVVGGESLTVGYEVANTGEATDTQNITFAVNGTTEDTRAGLTLAGGETATGTFSYDTATGDAPAVSVSVASANDTATGTVTVLEPAAFAVSITDANSTVTEGETVTVEYAVENTGDVTATQNIMFAVNGTTEDTRAGLTLAGGETATGAFSYDTTTGDAPGIAVAVASETDSATRNVTVLEPAVFDVTITDANSTVTEGETVTVEYAVENTGDVTATQNITFGVNGTTEETRAGLTLAGGETATGTFSYDTATGDAPGIAVAVASDTNTATRNVTVLEPAVFAVSITDANNTVTEGETITVDYEVANTGEATDTQNITFTVDGTTEEMRADLTLAGGETATGTFTYTTENGSAPNELTIEVASADDAATRTVTVEVDVFDLSASLSNETGTVGGTVGVDLNVTSIKNQNDELGSYVLTISYDSSVLDFSDIDAGEWGSPANVNEGENTVSISDFSLGVQTPSEPGLTFNFTVVDTGTAAVQFDEGDSGINDEDANSYTVTFNNGTVDASASSAASTEARLRTLRGPAVS